MSTNDLVKYVTEQVVMYMDTPKEEREKQRQLKKMNRMPKSYVLFGIVPFCVKLLFKRSKL